jgi:hypothetical protein
MVSRDGDQDRSAAERLMEEIMLEKYGLEPNDPIVNTAAWRRIVQESAAGCVTWLEELGLPTPRPGITRAECRELAQRAAAEARLDEDLRRAEQHAEYMMTYFYRQEPGVPGPGSPKWKRRRQRFAFALVAEVAARFGTNVSSAPSQEETWRKMDEDGHDRDVGWQMLREDLLEA